MYGKRQTLPRPTATPIKVRIVAILEEKSCRFAKAGIFSFYRECLLNGFAKFKGKIFCLDLGSYFLLP